MCCTQVVKNQQGFKEKCIEYMYIEHKWAMLENYMSSQSLCVGKRNLRVTWYKEVRGTVQDGKVNKTLTWSWMKINNFTKLLRVTWRTLNIESDWIEMKLISRRCLQWQLSTILRLPAFSAVKYYCDNSFNLSMLLMRHCTVELLVSCIRLHSGLRVLLRSLPRKASLWIENGKAWRVYIWYLARFSVYSP